MSYHVSGASHRIQHPRSGGCHRCSQCGSGAWYRLEGVGGDHKGGVLRITSHRITCMQHAFAAHVHRMHTARQPRMPYGVDTCLIRAHVHTHTCTHTHIHTYAHTHTCQEKKKNNPIARLIHALKLDENTITLQLSEGLRHLHAGEMMWMCMLCACVCVCACACGCGTRAVAALWRVSLKRMVRFHEANMMSDMYLYDMPHVC